MTICICAYVCECRGQRRMSRSTCPVCLRQSLPEPRVVASKPWRSSCLHAMALGLQAHTGPCLVFYGGAGGSNKVPMLAKPVFLPTGQPPHAHSSLTRQNSVVLVQERKRIVELKVHSLIHSFTHSLGMSSGALFPQTSAAKMQSDQAQSLYVKISLSQADAK